MRHLGIGFLVAALALPIAAQSPKFIKIDVISQSGHILKHGKEVSGEREPDTVQVRLPISLAKTVLEGIEEKEIKINGMEKNKIKVDQLIDMLKNSNPGDLLLEVKTGKGDLVRITLE